MLGTMCAAFLLVAWPGLPMAWDEGNAILRSRGISRWAARPGFDAESISRDWQYTTAVEGHPAFSGIVAAAFSDLAGRYVEPLTAARLGPILLFALAVGAMFYRMNRDFSATAAFASVAALMVMPRVLAHAHFATWDGPLLSCWVIAWATFPTGKRSWLAAVLFGLALGMTMSAKATGWLAPLAFVLWAIVYRDRRAMACLAVGLPIAVAVFVLLNPPLWHNPPGGIVEFLRLNLNRGDNPNFNISTQFLGRMYNLDYPLPWYNTLFWTAITVPVAVLLMAIVGLGVTLRHPGREKTAMLLVFNWLLLVVVRAVPGTPPHDGVRLFLPSFAFLAMLAGVGAAWLVARSHNKTKPLATSHKRLSATSTLVVLCFLASTTSVYHYAPQWLSYYNLFIGGVHGAEAAGMEPTYYWDALDESTLRWLEQNTPAHEKICFAAGPSDNLSLLEEWGVLQNEFRAKAAGKFRWYVLQRRPSGWQAVDRYLMENYRPVFVKTVGGEGYDCRQLEKPQTPGGRWAWRRDTRLLEIYRYCDYELSRTNTN